MEKYYANIKVSGNKKELKTFLILCKKIEYLCDVGASREIPIHIDGDGSANLQFEFKGIIIELDTKKLEKELNTGGKLKPIFIGE